MRVAAEGGSGLTERSEKPGDDPIFGDGISPARNGNSFRGHEHHCSTVVDAIEGQMFQVFSDSAMRTVRIASFA